jgi:hypothetical protein
MTRIRWILPLAAAAALVPGTAFAYIGPGAGLGMIGSVIALLGAILVALFGLIMFPITLLRRRRKTQADTALPTSASATKAEAAKGD